MKTSEMSIEMKKTLDKLVSLFLDRNIQYAGEEEWAANFNRSAKLNKILRVDKMITKPYGKSISMVIDKIDRLTNGIVVQDQGIKTTHIEDSIDDAIVYLFITKMLLKEANIIENKVKCAYCDEEATRKCSKCNKSICHREVFQDNPTICKDCFGREDK